VARKPVATANPAAGGISSGRALAAVLAAGAAGAWLGTALSACTEALTSDRARRALFGAQDTDTMTTRVFDVALGYPWPRHVPERVVRHAFAERWDGREDELAVDSQARQTVGEDSGLAPVDAGQGVAMLTTSRSAADVLDQFCADARGLLDGWAAPPVT
jgi:nitronate monooxygenase